MRRVILALCAIMLLVLPSCTNGPSTKYVSGTGLSKTKPDLLTQRRILLLHPESGEKLDIIYFHNGAYDQSALSKINKLLRDRHANVIGEIDPELIDYMVDIRTRLGLPQTLVFKVLSGYRTPETNAMLAQHNKNVALESTHIHGWAVDFRIDDVDGRAICGIAKTMQRGGVAYYPRDNHVHIDLGNIRTWQEK